MKLATLHKQRGDEVKFVSGCDPSVLPRTDLFDPKATWDRVYISTLFTFGFRCTVDTVEYYKEAVGGTLSKIFVGGIMATLMADELHTATNVRPVTGILHSPSTIGINGRGIDIDALPPDYDILDSKLYAVNQTYYAYTTRGCINKCGWCGVPTIEPTYTDYIDIKPMITELRSRYGDKQGLKLMDNNVLASKRLQQIVEDLLELGYGRGEFTKSHPKRARFVDFNQGLDASFVSRESMKILSQVNIRPMRIAFDRVGEKTQYVRALELAHEFGVPEFSNYMLYNYKDSPRDLYDRLMVNVELNERWLEGRISGKIYSYPMRYAPIWDKHGDGRNRHREAESVANNRRVEWLESPTWNRRFTRNIEIIKGATHGAISPTPGLARRALGHSFREYLANLYMPEMLLRNRNAHERLTYSNDPKRKPGTGLVEKFRSFILDLLEKGDDRFVLFHKAVAENSAAAVREALQTTRDPEIRRWLKLYVKDTNE
jgi:hypothetical protein